MRFTLQDDAGRIYGYSGNSDYAAIVFSTRELAEAEQYGALEVVELTAANVNDFVSRCKRYKLAGVLIDADDVAQASRARRATFPELIRAAHIKANGGLEPL